MTPAPPRVFCRTNQVTQRPPRAFESGLRSCRRPAPQICTRQSCPFSNASACRTGHLKMSNLSALERRKYAAAAAKFRAQYAAAEANRELTLNFGGELALALEREHWLEKNGLQEYMEFEKKSPAALQHAPPHSERVAKLRKIESDEAQSAILNVQPEINIAAPQMDRVMELKNQDPLSTCLFRQLLHLHRQKI